MKRLFIILSSVVFLFGCNGRTSVNYTVGDTMGNQEHHKGRYIVEFENMTIPFFGKTLVI